MPAQRAGEVVSRQRRFGRGVAQLAGANSLVVVLAFVTSPILTRTLGPAGRGEVAAVSVVIAIAPWFFDFGISSFLTREAARGDRPLGDMIGSCLPIALTGCALSLALTIPFAHLIGHGRPEVVRYIEVAMYTVPPAVLLRSLAGIANGQQRWGLTNFTVLTGVLGQTVTIVVLAVVGHVTVAAVSITYAAWGLASIIPFAVAMRGAGRLRCRAVELRDAVRFSFRSWLTAVASGSNQQLDQVVMAAVLPSRALGFYALAVTLSSVSNGLIGALGTALLPRVARGEAALAAQVCRMTGLLISVLNLLGAIISPLVVPLIFGRDFSPVTPLLWVLLVGSVFYAQFTVLSSALVAAGRPGATAVAQIAGLLVTVVGLVALLPLLGAMGAAVVTTAAYFATFVVVVRSASATFELGWASLVVPGTEDVNLVLGRLKRLASRS